MTSTSPRPSTSWTTTRPSWRGIDDIVRASYRRAARCEPTSFVQNAIAAHHDLLFAVDRAVPLEQLLAADCACSTAPRRSAPATSTTVARGTERRIQRNIVIDRSLVGRSRPSRSGAAAPVKSSAVPSGHMRAAPGVAKQCNQLGSNQLHASSATVRACHAGDLGHTLAAANVRKVGQPRVRRVRQPRSPLAAAATRSHVSAPCSRARSLRFTPPRSSSASSSARRSSCSRPSSPARCRRSRASYSVWIVSGVLTLFGALIAAELASAYPHAGGVYVFLREAFSPAVGVSVGLGDVLDDAHRHHRRHRDGVRALRRVLLSGRRRGHCALLAVGAVIAAHGGELRRRPAGKSRPDDAHDRQGRRGRRHHRASRSRSARAFRSSASAVHGVLPQPRRRHSRSLSFRSPSSPACSRSAAGTW